MKATFTRIASFLLILTMSFTAKEVVSQTGVFNPNDPIVVYNPSSPPAQPPSGQVGKWVKTNRLGWNTSSYKAYIYNTMAFRLKWPKNWAPGDGKKYPLYVFFHGVGERGTIYDNEFQLYHGGQRHHNAVENGEFDGFLLYPQSSASSGGWNNAYLDIVANLIENFLVPQLQVDPFRVSVNGLSGGGGATWEFMVRHPRLTAAALPMSGSSIVHVNQVPGLIYNQFWISNGGLDNSPSPYTVNQILNAAQTQGANYRHTFYADLGHGVWNRFWNEPDYFPYMMSTYKANPWVRYGRTEFCPGDPINVTLGVTGGFNSYQWRKDGVLINGANSNTIQVTSLGTYSCRILKGSTWSEWSPIPAVIKIKEATVSPDIQVSGLASRVLPSPDGKTTVNLQVPAGYTSYVWRKLNPTTTLSSTTNTLNNVGVGTYQVRVTEQYGCSSEFSAPFEVVNANGPNKPSPASSLAATTLSQTSVRLNWILDPAPANPETQFEVYQSEAQSGPYKLVGFVPARVDSFVISDLSPNSRYYYQVRAINNTAASAISNVASALTFADNIAPTPPNDLRTGTTGKTHVELFWDASEDNSGIAGYDVYVNGHIAYSVGPDENTATVYNLVNGTYYNIFVKARDLAGNVSPASNQVTVAPAFTGLNYKYYTFTGTWNNLPNFNNLTPLATGNMPNVSLQPRTQDDNFAFLWEGFINIPVSGQYTFRTNSDDGSRLWLGSRNGTTSPYSFSGTPTVNNDGLHGPQDRNSSVLNLTAGVYPIAMAFYEQGGGEVMTVSWRTPQTSNQFVTIPDGAFAQQVADPGPVPTAPSNLVATTVSSRKIVLNWSDNSNNETAFEIYRANNANGPFAIIRTVAANKTTYSDSSLAPSTTYFYKIRAINKNGSSAFDSNGMGVDYAYYENTGLSNLPNFDNLTPKKTGRVSTFGLGMQDRGDDFQLKFSGYINITTAGNYTFYTTSDDGSKLYIGAFNEANRVVNNDGLHGSQERSGTRNLSVGLHPIFVTFFEAGGGEVLEVRYAGPGISKRLIPASVLGTPTASATTQALPALPLAPSGLAGTVLGADRISLTWTNNSSPANVVKYEVWHSPNNASNYELAGEVSGSGTTFLDSNLVASTTYYFKVRAINEAGNSGYSNEINLVTSAQPVTVVTLTPIANQTITNDAFSSINVSATTNLGSSITYSTTGLPAFAGITENGNGNATITLAPKPADIGIYPVTVTATDNFGGTASRTFTITVNGQNQQTINLNFNGTLPAPAPWNNTNKNPTANSVTSNLVTTTGVTTSVSVTLLNAMTGQLANGLTTGNNSGIYPDNVLRSVYYASPNTTYQLRVSGLSTSKKYSFIIYAGFPWSAAEQAAQGTLKGDYTIAGQTKSLDAANNFTNTIQFSGISPDASGNVVMTFKKSSGSAFVLLGVLQILSYDFAPSFTPPSNLTASGISASSVRLNWQPSPDITTGYQVWRSTSSNGTYTLRGTVGANVNTYTDNGLSQNQTYFYKVRAVNGGNYSDYSNVAGGSTVSFVVKLNLNSEAVLSAPSPWNNLNIILYEGFNLQNMINMEGQPTGIGFGVDKNFTSFHDGVGITTGNNSGVVPDNVMRTLYYCSFGDTARVLVTGLSRANVYNFEFYAGSTFNYPDLSIWKVGNETVTLTGLNNTTNTVTITGIRPDSLGNVEITFTSGINYSFFNALIIHGMTAPELMDSDSPGTPPSGRRAADEPALAAVSIQTAENELQLGAYPNPFIDRVLITANIKKHTPNLSVIISDITGKVILTRQYGNVPKGNWQQVINLDKTLPPGMYIVRVVGEQNDKPEVIKLLKARN
ncbi:MAG: fibronectin type III domain-containing protein [Chitinophagaceae bacterium]|nr:fibronectin type III domain-containing protein [Chitinophagaceae bacterium]MCW5928535.1 fibronectin type III domain-containing protein [Chitinophagaceae bacterium]